MVTVTTVPLVRVVVPMDNPAGRFEGAKLAAVILDAYVPLESVYVIEAPLTACPTLRLPKPLDVTAICGNVAAAVFIAALRTAVPAL